MGKLQKALRHDQRRSLAAKNKVAKLTPDEIRSLNHSVGLTKSDSVRSLDTHSVHRLASGSPPLTPDNPNPIRRSQSQRRSSADLPTPPISPDRERRGSASSTRHIHAPKPVSHAQAAHLANANSISRPSSQSSYRGLVTYRGNEITRNNSLTMLQHPSQQIVSNPLSQFSRPRQSIIASSTSPPKSGLEYRVADDTAGSFNVNDRTRSLGGVDQGVTRDHSPIRPSDSPVSMDEAEMPDNKMRKQADGLHGIPVLHVTPRTNGQIKQDEQTEPTAKQKLNWRRTLTGSSEPDPEIVRLRKEGRRRTLLSPKNGYCLHAIHYDDTKPGQPPQLRETLRDELPSAKTSVFKEDERKEAAQETEYGQHPAVRPLSHETQRSLPDGSDSSPTSSSRKGKEKEIDTPGVTDSDSSSMTSSVPSYSRCSCCGRVQKPGGFESDLSPVMENENLRTNFNFEVGRMSAERRRRSSSVTSDGPRKYTPIIPMEVGNATKQARIEPARESTAHVPAPAPAATSEPKAVIVGVAVNKPGDIIASHSTPLAIMPRRRVDPRIVRFASLHRTKEEKAEDEAEQNRAEAAANLASPPTIQRFGSLYGLRNENQRQQQQQPQQSQQQQYQQYSLHQQQIQQHQNMQNAYQQQQQQQPPRQQQRTNSSHPLRVSHHAYNEVTLPQSEPNYSYSPIESHAVEKPLGDSPVSKRSIPASPQSNFSSEDGAEMVDLSSFDGSFNNHNLSRSGTVMRDASRPTTSHGEPRDQNQTHGSNQNQTFNDNRINNQSHNQNQLNNLESATPNPSALSDKLNTSSTSSLNSPSAQSAPSNTGVPSNNRTYRQPPPPPLNTNTNTNTTTVVRLVPSLPILSSSSSNPQLNGKGPMKLGDWILPESPTTQSLGSRKGSMQGEQLRGVTAV